VKEGEKCIYIEPFTYQQREVTFLRDLGSKSEYRDTDGVVKTCHPNWLSEKKLPLTIRKRPMYETGPSRTKAKDDRNWYLGQIVKGAQGKFTVVKVRKRGSGINAPPIEYVIMYNSGPLAYQAFVVPARVGETPTRVDGITVLESIAEKEQFLNTFYDQYPDAYLEVWRSGMTSSGMVRRLEEEWPELFERAIEVYGRTRARLLE